MLRLYRRIRYGDTSTPKYITKQHRWLYKNKWVGIEKVCEHYHCEKPSYTYFECADKLHMYRTVHSFDELLNAYIHADTDLKLSDVTDLSKQELEAIMSVQKWFYDRRFTKYLDELKEITDKIENMRF